MRRSYNLQILIYFYQTLTFKNIYQSIINQLSFIGFYQQRRMIPKNVNKILSSPVLQREYFLKPYGLQTPKNMNYPKKHPQYKFLQHKLLLHRPGKALQKNVLVFKINQRLSKPQLKQYLEKLYKFNIQKINTARFQGVVYSTADRKMKVTKPWKKAYVQIKQQIDPFLNTPK